MFPVRLSILCRLSDIARNPVVDWHDISRAVWSNKQHDVMRCCREAVKPKYSSVFRLGKSAWRHPMFRRIRSTQVGYIAWLWSSLSVLLRSYLQVDYDIMGLFSNYSPQQELRPVNPPVGIYSNFTAKQPTMLTLREHAFSFSGVCCLLLTCCDTVIRPSDV